MNKKGLLIGIILIAVAGAGFWLISGSSSFSGEVVAVVNGEEIPREDFEIQMQQFEQQLKAQGQESQLDDEEFRSQIRQQALDFVVGRVLLYQEAKAQGFSASSTEIDSEYQNVVERAGGEEAVQQRFQETGISEEDLKEDLRIQIVTRKFLDSKNEVAVTDQEISDRYNQLSEQSEAEVPPLEDVREQIRTQLVSEKEQSYISGLIPQLKEDADIDIQISI